MKKTAVKLKFKQSFARINDWLGRYDATIEQAISNNVWFIAMYHRVIASEKDDPYHLGMCVTAEQFTAQLQYLKAHFDIWPLSKVITYLNNHDPLPNNLATITFDDGYRDNLQIAAPILQKLDIPWTLFITTGNVDERQSFWWDRVIHAFLNSSNPQLATRFFGDTQDQSVAISDFEAKKHYLQQCLDYYWTLHIDQCESLVSELQRHLGVTEHYPIERLSNEEIRRLYDTDGVSIGCHTVRHPNLSLLNSEELKQELAQSKAYLENLLQAPINEFAYPGGKKSQVVTDAVKAAAFSVAVSTERGWNSSISDPFNLQRIGMPSTTLAHLKHSISRLYQDEKKPG